MTNHPIHPPPPDPPLVYDLLQYVLLISEAEHLLAGDMPLISCLHRGKKSGKNCFKSSRKNLAIKKKTSGKTLPFLPFVAEFQEVSVAVSLWLCFLFLFEAKEPETKKT